MFVSTSLLLLGYFITEKIVEPQLGPYNGNELDDEENDLANAAEVTPLEKKALWAATGTFIVMGVILALTVVPENGILRNQETGLIVILFLKIYCCLYFLILCNTGYCLRMD